MATTTGLTIDDFERLPADAVRYRELVNGELVDVSGNTPRHNLIRDLLVSVIRAWIARGNGGSTIAEQEYDFGGNAHGPDVSYFGPAKEPLLDLDRRVQRFVPDLAVEIASASDTYGGLLLKKDRYRRAGVAEVWLISTEIPEVAIYNAGGVRAFGLGESLTSELLPGFALAVDDLFRGL